MSIKFCVLIILSTFSSNAQEKCDGPRVQNEAFFMLNCQFSEFDLGSSRLSLLRVYAINNKVQQLNDSNFKGAKNFKKIDVSFNKIENISCRVFEDQEKIDFVKFNRKSS